jgi:hypothetical protein
MEIDMNKLNYYKKRAEGLSMHDITETLIRNQVYMNEWSRELPHDDPMLRELMDEKMAFLAEKMDRLNALRRMHP